VTQNWFIAASSTGKHAAGVVNGAPAVLCSTATYRFNPMACSMHQDQTQRQRQTRIKDDQ